MSTIALKLRRLEGQAAALPSREDADREAERVQAGKALFDTLEACYPKVVLPVPPYFLGSGEQIAAAARRVCAGVATDVDMAALETMPKEALQAFGCTAADFLQAVGSVYAPA